MELVEFAIQIKDLWSNPLVKFGTQTQKVFQQSTSYVSKLTEHNKVLGQSYSTIQQKITAVEATIRNSTIPTQIREARKELTTLQKQAANHPGAISQVSNGGGNMFGSIKGMMATAGVTFGLYQFGAMMSSGVEKAHELHQAEAQVRAGLLSTGQAAGMTYTAIEDVVNRIKSNSLYSKGELMDMQALLITFPDVTSKTFGSASQAIVDMSSRMHQDLKASAVEVGKALQDPITGITALRRIGVNFDKEQSKVIANLVKNGHKAEAQQRILTELNREFGGSAKAAFDADPLAKYNKAVGSIKMELGEFAIKLQTILSPALMGVANLFKDGFHLAKQLWGMFKTGNPIVIGSAIAIGALTVGIAAYNIVQLFASETTRKWVTAQLALSKAMLISPITLWVAGIIALIAIIGIIIYKVDGWGKTWSNLIQFMKLGTNSFVTFFQLQWLYFKNDFMTGLEMIEKGWYKLKGLWDKEGANAGLAALEKNRNDRAAEIAAYQGKLSQLTKQMGDMKVWELKWNDKKPGDIVKGIKKGLGLATGSNSSLMGNNAALGQGNAAGSAANEKAITSGGPKVINITVGKFLDNINIHTQNMTEGAQDMEQKILEMFSRVLAQGAITAQ